MQLQFSRRADHDLDRLYEFLIENDASIRTADRAILDIRDSAKSLLDNPEIGTEICDETGRREWSVSFGKGAYVLRYMPDYEAKIIRGKTLRRCVDRSGTSMPI